MRNKIEIINEVSLAEGISKALDQLQTTLVKGIKIGFTQSIWENKIGDYYVSCCLGTENDTAAYLPLYDIMDADKLNDWMNDNEELTSAVKECSQCVNNVSFQFVAYDAEERKITLQFTKTA